VPTNRAKSTYERLYLGNYKCLKVGTKHVDYISEECHAHKPPKTLAPTFSKILFLFYFMSSQNAPKGGW